MIVKICSRKRFTNVILKKLFVSRLDAQLLLHRTLSVVDTIHQLHSRIM